MRKIYLRGPLLTQSGYGHHARTVLRALKSRPDMFDVYIQPIPWGSTSWLWKDDEERREYDTLLNKTISYINSGGSFDASIQVTIPNEWERLAPINIGVTAGIETDRVSIEWIQKSFLMDKILTISKHSVDTFAGTVYDATNKETGEQSTFRATSPIECISYPVRKFEPKKIDLNLTTNFNFLAVKQLSPRKNANQLVKAFVETFKDNEDVGLIIKANMAKNSLLDRITTINGFKKLLMEFPDRKCKIYLLHGFLDDNEMAGLYTHPKIKALVSTTHGEGFGLPIFEAAFYGMPVVATDWSGHLDFLYMSTKQKNGKTKQKPMFSRITYVLDKVNKEAVWENIIVEDSKWAHPEEGSIKLRLEELYKDQGRHKKRAKELQKWITKEFDEDKINAQYIESLREVCNFDIEQEVDDLFDELVSNQ